MKMFRNFRDAVEAQFNKMAKGRLYIIKTTDKNDVWERYLDAFPAGTNEIYKERREYDCQTCKSFIKRIGNVVAVIDNKLVSVWDVEVESYYQEVADTLAKYVKKREIKDIFLHGEKMAGNPRNNQLLDDDSIITWEHFSCEIPNRFVVDNVAELKGSVRQRKEVFERGMKELTLDSAEIVIDLVLQNSLYRGEEHVEAVKSFVKMKKKYDKFKNDKKRSFFAWENAGDRGVPIRNTVIGSLLQDLSEGKGIDIAVASFETKVAPSNYKRTSAPVTKGMVKKAVEKIDELGIESSLHRRYAVPTDISINNVLFADRSVVPKMKDSLEDLLLGDVKVSNKNYDKVDDIGVDDFFADVLPNISSMEVLMTNIHKQNLMSVIAPKIEDTHKLLKWDNDFSWSYNGNITDSMKERVKNAGGDVTGVLRFSIQWNEEGMDGRNDLDAHCKTPDAHIYYSSKRDRRTGELDIDITNPQGQTSDGVAVENITWQDKNKMVDGTYDFYVKNYSGVNKKGFRAQVEFDGVVHSFSHDRAVSRDVPVATVTLKNGEFTINTKLESSQQSVDVWGVKTEVFQKVSMVMLSPNHWDEQNIGNRHHFFILDGCNNPENARGIYNEFLRSDLTEHRKVFEVLADRMLCDDSDTQLSGLGFSSTKRSELIVKVSGAFNRMLKIKF